MNARFFRCLLLLLMVPGVVSLPHAGGAAEVHYSTWNRERTRPASEVRAVWVTRWDFWSARDIRTIVSNCASLGLNRIYLQVRGQADALYRSSHEPWAEELGGDPGYDPLGFAIEACRKSRIEIHAWVNVLPGWKGSRPPTSPDHVLHRQPGWFLQDSKGRRNLLSTQRYTLLNPCLPEVRAHLVKVVGEIAGYDVDGIQFDYVRFLSRSVNRGEDVPYDSPTLARFRRQTGGFPSRHPRAWDRFRQDAMDTLVRELSVEIRRRRPCTIISVAAVKDLERARNHLFQDVVEWSRRGWIDEVSPMVYTANRDSFGRSIRRFTDEIAPAQVIPGIGIYTIGAAAGRDEIAHTRKESAAGYALFGYTSLFLSRSPTSSRSARAAELRARMRKMVSTANRPGLASQR